MKNWIFGLMVTMLLAVSPAANADLKIGYVNAAKVLDQSPQAELVASKLKQEFSGREKDLRESRKELKDLEDRMTRDGAIMSDAERSKLDRDIMVRKRDLQNSTDAFRDDLNLRRNDEMNKLLSTVQKTIVGIGKDLGYDLIVYEGVAYASPAIDITDKVLEKLKAMPPAGDTSSAPKK